MGAGTVMRDWSDEAGSITTSIAGVMIFLGFLLMAAQTTLHLYGTSVVTAAAFDTARRAAVDPGFPCEQALRQRLGDYGARRDVEVRCDEATDRVVVSVDGPSPARLLAGFGHATGIDTLSRSVSVRREAFVGSR